MSADAERRARGEQVYALQGGEGCPALPSCSYDEQSGQTRIPIQLIPPHTPLPRKDRTERQTRTAPARGEDAAGRAGKGAAAGAPESCRAPPEDAVRVVPGCALPLRLPSDGAQGSTVFLCSAR
ncbi:uncharacterized protein LOC143655627 isoform X2 [Tamandua tetradactyla]|uniref:uncharacterized protein LOC143655627 isoform X2 n=1 Tax=Tamandua tetradactyla TaxID=48850 RepID=UPI00405425C4